MANAIITPQVVAREILYQLYELAQVSQTVHRDFDGDFAGSQGETINVRRPATFVANEFNRATGIVVQDINETSVPVSLDTLLDVSFAITTEQATLSLDEWSTRVGRPAAEALLADIEVRTLTSLLGTTNTVGTDGTPATDPTLLVDMGAVLDANNVPKSERFTALTTTVAANFSKSALFHEADKRGDTEGITEASIGRKFGFNNMSTTNMPAGGDSVGYHRTAVALAFRTPEPPEGVAAEQVEVMEYRGFGLRCVKAYDISKKQDVVSIDCLMGATELDEDRAVKLLG